MAKIRNYNFLGNYTYYVPGVADMFIILAWLLLGSIIGSIANVVFIKILGPDTGMEYGMIVAYPLMFIPAMMYASIKSRKNSYFRKGVKLDSNNFAPHNGAVCALVVMVATLALAFCTDFLSSLMPPMPSWLEEALGSMTTGDFFVNFLCVSIFAPIFEEWLCRGMVLRGLLNNNMKPVWAIVISAVFFAVIHANPWQAIPAFFLGTLFAYVYYKTGSIKLTMLMHCTNNTFALICSNIDKLEDMESWRDVFSGPSYWIIFTGCALLTVLSVLFFKKVALIRHSGNSDEVPQVFE